MIKNIKSVCVLVAICTVVALLLALTNQITAPIIAKNEALKASGALRKVMPKGKAFEQLNLGDYKGKLPSSVTEVHKETEGKGYVIQLSVKGFKPDMVIMCGVTTDGKITGAICLSSNETNGAEKDYGKQFVGKDAAGVDAVDTVGGSTYTTEAYKKAIQDAQLAVRALGGENVETRTPEEIFNDNLAAALPAAEGKFTQVFITEVIEGVSAIYAADNGKGYVCISGEAFIATDAEGNSDDAVAAAAVKTIKASTGEDILAAFQAQMDAVIAATDDTTLQSEYTSIKSNVTGISKTATGNYDITINGLGFGYFGDEHSYQPAKNIPIVIRVSITPEGKIIDTLTVSHSESNGYGAAWGTEKYYGQFDGTTAETYDDVDTVGGATISNTGYLKAISRCFTVVTIMEGGAE